MTPLAALSGRLTGAVPPEALAAHVALTRAEAGCLRFDVEPEGEGVWQVDELFADDVAFAAHQARTRASAWWTATAAMSRDFQRRSVMPVLRDERADDQATIRALTDAAFGGPDESRIIDDLRAAGDLRLSLVAEAEGVILGHVGFSPVAGLGRPAFALAPLAVLPQMQRRGIGAALVREGLARLSPAPVVVLGDPAYYRRFGFAPVAWGSPFAGPYLMALGPDLPQAASIRHAAAFG